MIKSTLILVFVIALFSACKTTNNQVLNLAIGTYTNETSEGIYLVKFDEELGTFSDLSLGYTMNNPSFQFYEPASNSLFSVGQNSGKSYAYSFHVMAMNTLSINDSIEIEGRGACHVTTSNTNQSIVVSNYGSGNINQIFYDDKFMFNSMISYQHVGSSVQIDRQEAPHAHSVTFDLNNQFAYGCDLGADKIYIYKNNAEAISLVDSILMKPGSGPRHLAFHPSGNYMAVLNELSSTIDLFRANTSGVYSQKTFSYSTLPDTCSQFTKAADIHFTPNGKFLYASNRGCNSIASFQCTTNQLELIDIQFEKCNWIRNFTITPNNKYLLAANRFSNSIVVYTIDDNSGKLKPTNEVLTISQPVCITLMKKDAQ